MISDCKDSETEKILHGERSAKLPSDIQQLARRKLRMLMVAQELRDLGSPPGNRLEKLNGDREGQYSIRINDQWRICFNWKNGAASEVEITDYH